MHKEHKLIQSYLYTHLTTKPFPYHILLTKDATEAKNALEVFKLFNVPNVFIFPELRMHFGDDLSAFRADFLSALGVLREFYAASGAKVLISPISSVLYPLPKAQMLVGFDIALHKSYDISELQAKITNFGYEIVEVVELEGEVSFRGDIIDIFMPNATNPHRIVFFDNEIESIRTFDIKSQMSNPSEIECLSITPALFANANVSTMQEAIDKSNFSGFNKDIAAFGLWVLGENATLLPLQFSTLLTKDALTEAKEIYSLDSMPHAITLKDLESMPTCAYEATSADIIFNIATLDAMLKAHANKQITIIAPNDIKLKALEADISIAKIIYSSAVVNVLTKDRLVLSLNANIATKKHKKPKLKLNEITKGEYVVHSDYGIGKFLGIKQAQVAGALRDFIEILYDSDDRLLLPIENLNMIDRYVADSSQIPALDRLGKGSFAKLKQKVKAKLLAIAQGIIELAAKRKLLQGAKIDVSNPALIAFSKSCGFELTSDQAQSIADIFSDLSSSRVMDRLISGDVGFGKTEVALNAAYAVLLSGYQVAMLVPTTILSAQHFATFNARLSHLGFKVARCDRFIKHKQDIFSALKKGEINAVIGTHALLGAEFKNLGLIIVDEEHRFGVKQKEQIKALSSNTHLLSMSATPIPRTLNMALSHIKSLSSLHTPPLERLPVRTFIKTPSEALIKEIILRELRRGGQVFYIHNNIASIDRKASELQSLLPQLKIAILHSHISNENAEKIMYDFANNAYSVLLCTSIVESGIHLPNANTIIVEGADRFGIADLHQLRGRVGRSNKEGFCYLFINDVNAITSEAKKRLLALEKNSYLGSGENLAYYDLEIRGGGNLLGEAQSGHIKHIGYGLYLKMLEDYINELSGKGLAESKSCDIKININAFLDSSLITSDNLRLELYARLSQCMELDEVSDIEAEIFDRFGALDSNSKAFLELIRIKVLANKLNLKQILHFNQNITFITQDNQKETIIAPSKDYDDVLNTALVALRARLKSMKEGKANEI